ncbi:hypothetical protein PV325_004472 [Microctonus aethiopoides]|nr:hypothetical protein PV325_004472 [Microctonus aethiopoides]
MVKELNEDDSEHTSMARILLGYWICHTRYPQKVNVWAGIFNDVLIDLFFIDGIFDESRDATQPQSLDKLRNRIQQKAFSIDGGMIPEAVTHFYNRTAFC